VSALRTAVDIRQEVYSKVRDAAELWGEHSEQVDSDSQPVMAIAREEVVRVTDRAIQITDSLESDLLDFGRRLSAHQADGKLGNADFRVAYEVLARLALLEDLDGLVDQSFQTLVLSQKRLIDKTQLQSPSVRAAVAAELDVSVARRKLTQDPLDLGIRMEKLKLALSPYFLPPDRLQEEVRLITATRKLAKNAIVALQDGSPAADAHLLLAERYLRAVDSHASKLPLTFREQTGVDDESFLKQLALPANSSAEWRALTADYNRICAESANSLERKDGAFAAVLSDLPSCLEASRYQADTARLIQHDASLDAGLVEAFEHERKEDLRNLATLQDAMAAIAHRRAELIDKLKSLQRGHKAGKMLASADVSKLCAELGVIYDSAASVAAAIDRQSLAILKNTRVQANLSETPPDGWDDTVSRFSTAHQAYRTTVTKLLGEVGRDSELLEEYAQLGLRIAKKYTDTISSVSADMLAQLDSSSTGSGSESLLRDMASASSREALALKRSVTAVLDNLQRANPQTGPPSRSWKQTSDLGGAIARMLRDGALLERETASTVAAVLGSGKVVSPADTADLIDLALALHYPIHTYVESSGMALLIGDTDRGLLVRGIGNVHSYAVPGARTTAYDFLWNEWTVGWDILGGIQEWCDDTGKAVDELGKELGQAADAALQVTHELGGQVLDGATKLAEAHVELMTEVGSFVYDTGCDYAHSFVEDPWKIVEYAGYGVAIVATGGAATPLVAIAIAADISESAVDVAEEREWIDESTANGARLVTGVVETVAGVAAGPGAGGSLSKLAKAGKILNAGGGVVNEVSDYLELEGHIDEQTADLFGMFGTGMQLAGAGATLYGNAKELAKQGHNISEMKDAAGHAGHHLKESAHHLKDALNPHNIKGALKTVTGWGGSHSPSDWLGVTSGFSHNAGLPLGYYSSTWGGALSEFTKAVQNGTDAAVRFGKFFHWGRKVWEYTDRLTWRSSDYFSGGDSQYRSAYEYTSDHVRKEVVQAWPGLDLDLLDMLYAAATASGELPETAVKRAPGSAKETRVEEWSIPAQTIGPFRFPSISFPSVSF